MITSHQIVRASQCFFCSFVIMHTNALNMAGEPVQAKVHLRVKDCGSEYVLIGRLGKELGESVAITGAVKTVKKIGRVIVVKNVDGVALDKPVMIPTSDFGNEKEGAIIEAVGYERGVVFILRTEDTGASNHDIRVSRQAISLTFVRVKTSQDREIIQKPFQTPTFHRSRG